MDQKGLVCFYILVVGDIGTCEKHLAEALSKSGMHIGSRPSADSKSRSKSGVYDETKKQNIRSKERRHIHGKRLEKFYVGKKNILDLRMIKKHDIYEIVRQRYSS